MAEIAGHTLLDKIFESANSLVYRAVRAQDTTPVVLKLLKDDYPLPAELTRYRQEYEITRSLALPGVVKTYGLEKHRNTLVMFLEDFGGTSLKFATNARPMAVGDFLRDALLICQILGEVHQQHIIHKDINPANIVVNRQNGVLKLIDFGISTRFNSETRGPANPTTLEGTLAYMSPEQTGRMNCPLDYRTDFYSLGVTFYELLTGDLPFSSADPLALVHHHLMREPEPPHLRNGRVPQVLSQMVLRLLAKSPEDRYQSARGIAVDLAHCLQQWREAQNIEVFTLGGGDHSRRFEIPSKLYGRQAEQEALFDAFQRVGERSAWMLVAGYSGIGKTALIQELHRPVTAARGIFISGKYDQFQRETPYSALTAAFRELMRQLLTEESERLEQWKRELLGNLGPNGQILIDVLPELALVIGVQAAVPELGPREATNRFQLTFLNFMRTFCREAHPLVLFLDDLQWVDAASLSLLELMLTDESLAHLFVIGSYRDNEVDGVHPLLLCRDRLRNQGVPLNELTLGPLDERHLRRLVADTLRLTPEEVVPLAAVTLAKTGGNPFFTAQFLGMLHHNGRVYFEEGEPGRWSWDQTAIEAMDITDNVVDLVITKLRTLPEPTQQVLRLASCVGNRFDLETLATIMQQPVPQTYQALQVAIGENLILPLSELTVYGSNPARDELVILSFKFLHDRIQQAAYALIEEAGKQQVHHQIGSLLLARLDPPERDKRIFELVDHLNMGLDHVVDEQNRIQLAELNLGAAQKALGSTAYEAAVGYLRHGIALLEPLGWEAHYDTLFTLHFELTRAIYLQGGLEASERVADQLLERARRDDQVRIHRLRVVQQTTAARFAQAIESGRKAVILCGEALPEEDLEAMVLEETKALEGALGEREVASLFEAPSMEDRRIGSVMGILDDMISCTFLGNPPLFKIVAMRMTRLSIQYGQSRQSAMGYSAYSIHLAGNCKSYRAADEFGKLAIALSEKYEDGAQLCQTIMNYYKYTHPWRNPLQECFEPFRKGYQAGLDAGNLNWSGYALNQMTVHKFYVGRHLEKLVNEDMVHAMHFLESKGIFTASGQLDAVRWAARALLGETGTRDYLAVGDGKAFAETCLKRNNRIGLFIAYTHQAQVLYLMEQAERALHYSRKALELLAFAGGFGIAEQRFYHGLILARHLEEAPQAGEGSWQELRDCLAQMKTWFEHCPANFSHKYHLLAAELYRIEGAELAAIDTYQKAVDAARANGFLHEEALINELAGRFWLTRGNDKIASVYLRDAHQCYRNWGASLKVTHLAERFPQFLGGGPRKKGVVSTTTTSGDDQLDLATVVQAAKAIREEKHLHDLLKQVVRIALTNANASSGFLVLHQDGQLIVKARGRLKDEILVETVSQDLEDCTDLSTGIVQYVARTAESVFLEDAGLDARFGNDPFVREHGCKSLICTPLLDQGDLVGIVYLENPSRAGAFTENRLEILQLLMMPAVFAIQNAIYKEENQSGSFEYQVGGSLAGDSASYVTRKADRDLYQLIQKGSFCFVLNPRQMGKSSLRVHLIKRLAAEGVKCVAIDLTLIGSDRTTFDQWYAGIARTIVMGLGLNREIPLRTWWREKDLLSPPQRLAALFEEEILERVSQPISVFIDEIDSVLSLSFETNDFFAMIRAFFNKRAEDPRYKQLTFVLLGVATPGDLIGDKQRTPFNIGKSIVLEGFHGPEVKPLYAGLADKGVDPETIMASVLAWTGGQPFLTQKACALLRLAKTRPRPEQISAWVGKIIRRNIIENWEVHDEPEHLKTIQDRILLSPRRRELLKLYRAVLRENGIAIEEDALNKELRLSGLVKPEWGKWVSGNAIYREVFSEVWVASHQVEA